MLHKLREDSVQLTVHAESWVCSNHNTSDLAIKELGKRLNTTCSLGGLGQNLPKLAYLLMTFNPIEVSHHAIGTPNKTVTTEGLNQVINSS
jgi:hypothetical protein